MNFTPLRRVFLNETANLDFLEFVFKLLAAPRPDVLSGAFAEVGLHSTVAAEFDPQLIMHPANKLASNW